LAEKYTNSNSDVEHGLMGQIRILKTKAEGIRNMQKKSYEESMHEPSMRM
jgi:hypothetical protein